jgi:hypothetical protein
MRTRNSSNVTKRAAVTMMTMSALVCLPPVSPTASADTYSDLPPATAGTIQLIPDSALIDLVVGCLQRVSEGSVTEDNFCTGLGAMLNPPVAQPTPPGEIEQ